MLIVQHGGTYVEDFPNHSVREVRQDEEGPNSLETPDSTHPLAKRIYFNPVLILLDIFTLFWSLES